MAIPIHHSLLHASGTKDKVKRVVAHSQALAQCQRWLDTNMPGVETVAVASNGHAAEMAANDPRLPALQVKRLLRTTH